MTKNPNWCPNCEKETDWLICPAQPNIVQCKKCGHMKKLSGVEAKTPKVEVRPDSKSIVTASSAFSTALAITFGAFLISSIWILAIYLSFQAGNFILGFIFSILAGLSASTVGAYILLSEVERIAEKKIMQKLKEVK